MALKLLVDSKNFLSDSQLVAAAAANSLSLSKEIEKVVFGGFMVLLLFLLLFLLLLLSIPINSLLSSSFSSSSLEPI